MKTEQVSIDVQLNTVDALNIECNKILKLSYFIVRLTSVLMDMHILISATKHWYSLIVQSYLMAALLKSIDQISISVSNIL